MMNQHTFSNIGAAQPPNTFIMTTPNTTKPMKINNIPNMTLPMNINNNMMNTIPTNQVSFSNHQQQTSTPQTHQTVLIPIGNYANASLVLISFFVCI